VHVEIEGDRDDIEVAGAFSVSKEGAFDAVGTGEECEFGGGGAGTAVVMGVDTDDGVFGAAKVGDEPLDLVGVHVGHGDLDRVGEIQNDFFVRRGLPGVHDGFADFQSEIDFCGGEAFRGVLEAEVGAGEEVFSLFDPSGTAASDVHDVLAFEAEDDAALGWGGAVVEVNDGVFGAFEGFEGALDEVFAGLDEDLDRDVIRDAAVFDEAAHECELRVGSRGEADFDLLEPAFHQGVEEFEFLGNVHGNGEGLVAVAEVDAAPDGGVGEGAIRPLAVGQVDRREGAVFLVWGRNHSR